MDNEFVTTERGDNSVKIHNKSARPRLWIGVSLKIINFQDTQGLKNNTTNSFLPRDAMH